MSTQTIFLIDGHVHIYPHYDLHVAIEQGIAHLVHHSQKLTTNMNEKIVPVWLLVERHDCHFFSQVYGSANDYKLQDITISPGADAETLVVRKNEEIVLYILAGRQIVARENLEIMSLVSTLFLKDREKSVAEVIDQVLKNNGVPVLNWAPGKWFFSRGEVVKRTLQQYAPNQLLVGDTSLRTTIWPLPAIMANAGERGFRTIAGSDPLPFTGEEQQIGRYGFMMRGAFDETQPARSMRKLLMDPNTPCTIFGKRNNPLTFARRQSKIMMS